MKNEIISVANLSRFIDFLVFLPKVRQILRAETELAFISKVSQPIYQDPKLIDKNDNHRSGIGGPRADQID